MKYYKLTSMTYTLSRRVTHYCVVEDLNKLNIYCFACCIKETFLQDYSCNSEEVASELQENL